MTAPTKAPTREIGETGLLEWAGVVSEEFLRDLENDRGIAMYKEMWWNTSVIGAMVRAITMMARQVHWRWEPAKPLEPTDSEQALSAAEETRNFVAGAWEDMSTTWDDVLAEILQGIVVFGWDYREIVYKIRQGPQPSPGKSSKFDDGKLGWRKFAERSQDSRVRWEFADDDGELLGMWQKLKDFKDVFIPVNRALLFRAERYKASPEGLSMLRSAYRDYYYHKRIQEIEAIGLERNLNGLPVMEVPAEITVSSATSAQKTSYAAAKDIVQNVRANDQGGVVMPQAYDDNNNKMYDLKLLSGGTRRGDDTDAILKRYESRIAMVVLADFLTLGHEGVGSFALSSNKTTMFNVAMGTLLDSVAAVINRHATPRLLALNGIDLALAPTLEHGDLDTSTILEDAEAVVKLGNAGMMLFPDEKLEAHLRTKAQWPEIDQAARDEMLAEKEAQKAEMNQRLAEREQLDSSQDGTSPGGDNE